MSARDELLALATRCEREEPSWALECEIGAAVLNAQSPASVIHQQGVWTINRHGTPLNPQWELYKPPRYTTSLDAAVTLVPEGAEWWEVYVESDWERGPAKAEVQPRRRATYKAFAQTPALALCAAALRARAAMEPT